MWPPPALRVHHQALSQADAEGISLTRMTVLYSSRKILLREICDLGSKQDLLRLFHPIQSASVMYQLFTFPIRPSFAFGSSRKVLGCSFCGLHPCESDVLDFEEALDAVLGALAAKPRLLHAAERRHLVSQSRCVYPTYNGANCRRLNHHNLDQAAERHGTPP
jgi:hypothetical protein